MKVKVSEELVVIPTYEAGEADQNPMFLEKRVYQGSSGRVYPHPVTESVSDEKHDKEYKAVFLENKYIKVMILPEIGGRIQRIYDKTNGYDAVYYNEVIKPALVGLAGPWISGGIEFNWPQHHRPSTFDPVSYTITENEDGSVTVWVSEIEKMFHTKGMAGFTVYPDKAYVEIRGQLYNPTERTQTFLWWANPAVAVNENTQSVFPPDVHAVMDHGKRDVSKFPIATGEYYKMDYSAGVDISRYKNIPVPTSYMAYHSDFNFVGNYDHGKNAGLLHIADHHISPGKKQWTWGCGDFGQAWDRNLTDENGPYIELMTGVYTDNQPDFTFIAPYEEKAFVQYFMPYKDAGAVKNATLDVMINLEYEDGAAYMKAYSPAELGAVSVKLYKEGEMIFEDRAVLMPDTSYSSELKVAAKAQDLKLEVSDEKGNVLCDYTPLEEKIEKTPDPASESPAPEDIASLEELYLTALHLEQYRHATYRSEDYYLEGLKRDKTDIRLNNGYGKLLYNRGEFAESERYFRTAIKKSVMKNPNPYDSEPYYNLGLSLKMQGRLAEAFDAFYKSIWSAAMQDMGYYQLALIASINNQYEEALELCEKGLVRNNHNIKARNLKTSLLRILDRKDEALEFAVKTQSIDPIDFGCRYEIYLINGTGIKDLKDILMDDSHNYIELAINYIDAGMMEDAMNILNMSNSNDLMLGYYKLLCTAKSGMDLSCCSIKYCFPNRLFDILVLENAIAEDNSDGRAMYLLGCLLYDKGQHMKAAQLWEKSCKVNPLFPTAYRNLSLYYFNKKNDKLKALEAMEKAFELDKSDARVFFELDQLYKQLNTPVQTRLENAEANIELVKQRDDMYTEYITLLNLSGQYSKALECMENHIFHPWEGGEGKITAQYRNALMALAKQDANMGNYELACDKLKRALVYPHNLGEGKLSGALDNDIYYMLGCFDKENAKEYFERASYGSSDLSSAMYYNDQPPEMFFFRAMAERKLSHENKARGFFNRLIDYGEQHINDHVKIDYFAVSLPDFLIYEADLDKKNYIHCCFMAALGYIGMDNKNKAYEYIKHGLEQDCTHKGLLDLLAEF